MGITRTGAEYNDMRHISIAKPSVGTEEIEAVTRVLESGQLAQGETVYQIERELRSEERGGGKGGRLRGRDRWRGGG
ncbi:hypothetical protein E4V51_16875, partial [Paenibacillus sp. 28ISP30-2]|nr:hypothetical protein [Paenibacillus sp. 28ISP30-2]